MHLNVTSRAMFNMYIVHSKIGNGKAFKFSKNKTNKNRYSDINLPIWLYCVIITTTAYYHHYNNLDISTFNIINLY